MRARLLVPLTLTLACTPDAGDDAGAGSSTGWDASSFGTGSATAAEPTTTAGSSTSATGEPATTDADPTTGGPAELDDEALLRQAIAGEVDAAGAVRTIADRGGFPVETATGSFLFACLCGQGAWALAGDHNGWAPAPMQQAGPLWWIEADVPAPDGSLYKFHEPGQALWIADPHGRRYGFDDFGRYSLVRASAAHLERWYAIDGADLGLAPRDLQVYVPAGGAFSHALYVHDGQNLFDPDAFWGGWRLQETVPPDLLIVGIDNVPVDRMSDYTHVPDDIGGGRPVGGEGEAYAELVDAVIRPRMEAAYGPAAVVGTMGSSLGGLISLVIADLYPARYDMAISLSGTLGWGSIGLDNETMLERYAAAGKREFSIYLDSGGGGACADLDMDGVDDDTDASDNYCENLQMSGILQQLGYTPDVDLFYVHDPDALHNEAAWAARVDVPLALFADLPADVP